MQTKVSERTRKPLSSSSIHGAYISHSKVFGYAIKHRMITTNPCAVVDKPRVKEEERAFLDPHQVRAVATRLGAFEPYGLIVGFSAYTGYRKGEMAALRIGDVRLLHKRVEVRRAVARVEGGWNFDTPKTARGVRDVPLGRPLVVELTEYFSQHPRRNEPEAPLWPGRVPGGSDDMYRMDATAGPGAELSPVPVIGAKRGIEVCSSGAGGSSGGFNLALAAASASRRSSFSSPGTSNRLPSASVVGRRDRSTYGAVRSTSYGALRSKSV